MEIGETGHRGQAAVGAVVVASNIVLDTAITLLRKMEGEIAVAAIEKLRPATHKIVMVITVANCCFAISSLSKKLPILLKNLHCGF